MIRERKLGFRHLDAAYRQAWERFCAEVAVLQSLFPQADNDAAVQDARNRVADAELCYRRNRSNLVQYMIASLPRGSARAARLLEVVAVFQSQDTEMPQRLLLERLAYQFWQDGGQRHGNAEADWYRAEASVCI